MDAFSNSKIRKQSIYEIYRACRLCGAGAGYKMPIIQSVVHLDAAEVELKQKIRECLQLEVSQNDRMPPLICELCVDKVNDFYEFLEMCRQTNQRTRQCLGLPLQAMPRGASDTGDCILGVTEPVYVNEDSEVSKTRSKNQKNIKPDSKSKVNLPIKKESRERDRAEGREGRALRSKAPSPPAPPPRPRASKRSSDDDVSLGSLLRSKRSAVQAPKSILKKTESEEPSPRSTRQKEKETPVKKEVLVKKVKIEAKSPPPKPSPKSRAPEHRCKLCRTRSIFSTQQALLSHVRHAHKRSVEVKKPVKRELSCDQCHKTFPSRGLLSIHTCSMHQPRKRDEKWHAASQQLKPHAAASRKPEPRPKPRKFVIPSHLRRKLRPIRVRVARCDPLLHNTRNGHCYVADVPFDYGIDEDCTYPYLWSQNINLESSRGYMVKINDDLRHALDDEQYVHWDSDEADSDPDSSQVGSLASITLKTLFSPKLLGKVPKKRRKVTAEKAFDSILNASDVDFDMKSGIDGIINRLDNDTSIIKDKSIKENDSDSFFGDDSSPAIITNDDFDSLFSQDNDKSAENIERNSHDVNKKIDDAKEATTDISLENTDRKDEEENKNKEDSKNNDGSEGDENRGPVETTESNAKLSKVEKTIVSSENEENNDDVGLGEETNNSGNNVNKENIAAPKDVNNIESIVDKSKDSIENINDDTSREVQKELIIDGKDKNIKNTEQESESDSNILDHKSEKDNNTDEKQVFNSNEEVKVNDIKDSSEILESSKIINSNKSETEREKQVDETKEREDNKSIIDTDIKQVNQDKEVIDKTETGTEKQMNGENDYDDINVDMDELEDLSDGEMDDQKLMDELDAQIGEKV